MMRKQLWGISALASFACLALVGPASALVADDNHATLAIQAPFSEDYIAYGAAAASFAPAEVERSLETKLGGNWTVYGWNRQSRSPHMVYGSGAVVAPPFTDDASVESAARYVLEQNSTALHVNPGQLRLDVVRSGMGKVAAHFVQTYEGIDVLGSRAFVVFTDQGRVFVMGSDYFAIEGLNVAPSLSAAQAETRAMNGLSFSQKNLSAQPDEATTMYVMPYATAIDQVEYRLVYKVTVETDGRTGVWESYVDANSGQILARQNDVHFVNYSGHTQGLVDDQNYCDGNATHPEGWMDVAVAGVGTATSNAAGDWTLANGDTTPRNATTQFFGPWINVNRASGQGADATQTQSATPGVPLTTDWNAGNSRADERDCFHSLSDLHDYFEILDPGYAYTNARITCNVGVNGTCNAFWNGSINFYNTGGGCHNTGEMEGVVAHEFGHGIQNNLIGGQGGEGLGEGNGDVASMLLTDEHIIGRGFFEGNCSTGIRDCQNTLQYPESKTGEVHDDGRIIAGVLWDCRQELEASLGAAPGKFRTAQLWHFGRKVLRPTTQPDQVMSMYITDDDDGNLDNGTPNYDAICTAATNHDTNQNGFPCPEILEGVFFVHDPLQTPQPAGDATINADVLTTIAGADIVDSSVRLHYTIGTNPETVVTMTPLGGNSYTAIIPGLQEGNEVAYWMEAADDMDNSGTAPRNAPADQYLFDLPTIFDDLETASGWTVNAEGTDDAGTGIWTRVNPNGTEAQPEDDHTADPGVICWVTGQGSVGGQVGENDVDNGTTTLYSPVYDLSATDNAKVKFFRWYSNDKGGRPNEDFWVVQVRNNGGAWIDVERNMTDQNTWHQTVADLGALLGGAPGNVQFKFIASDFVNEGSIVEAAVDDFEILASGSTVDAPETSNTARFALYGARPHPVNGPSVVSFQVPGTTKVKLDLYDVSGRQIRSLANGTFEGGAHDLAWDGKDSNGRVLASGVYFLRMDANEFHATRTVVVTR